MNSKIYLWGIIFDQQTRKRIKSHLPLEILIKPRLDGHFEQIACGTNFTVVLHSNHRVFVLGDEPKYGRLGLGDEITIAPTLTSIVGHLPPIASISCGSSTTLLLTSDRHELWAFGKGIGPIAKNIFHTEQTITHFACNDNSIVLVINFSRLVERHFNRNGFLSDWTSVYQSNDRIHHLDLGSALNGFVTEQGHVFLWGTSVPTGNSTTEEHFINVPIENPVERDLINTRPIQISCSRGQFHSHALLLTETGSIYAIGSNYKAKLGIDKNHQFASEWMLIDLTSSHSFQFVAAGGIHSSALSTDGRVLTWGCGSDGRLGHCESEGHRYLYKENQPRPVDALTHFYISAVATSYYHMGVIVGQRRT